MFRQLEPREIDARCVAGCCVYVLRSRGVSTTGAARRSPAANATRVALRAGPALTARCVAGWACSDDAGWGVGSTVFVARDAAGDC